MIVLDTNVLSALMSQKPDAAVISWLDSQAAEAIWTTSINTFEVTFGLRLLPAGKRRLHLERAFAAVTEEDLDGRILAFDEESARRAADLAARRRLAGRPIDFRDVEIAGIVASRNATLATRNTRDFVDLGIELVDPWRDTRV